MHLTRPLQQSCCKYDLSVGFACQQCMETTDDPKKCFAFREDYLECLHHRKEVSTNVPGCIASHRLQAL